MTQADDDVAIRPMTAADIAPVVALQLAFLDGSIVTQLGHGFLSAFHHAALGHPSSRAFVADGPKGAIGGFALASLDVAAFNRYVKRRVARPLLRALLTPRGAPLIWRFAQSVIEPEPEPYMPAELLLLTVDSRHRRRGIGQRLVEAVERAFARDGVTRYRVAVRSQLAVARAFYLATGFESEQEVLVLGRPMTYLTKRVARREKVVQGR
jgi:ribosomal protein S18 acetylase RimI-like enzyme